MISSRTGKDPVFTTSTPPSASTVSPSAHHVLPLRLLQHPVRHLRGILRLARQRRTFAFALLAGSAATAASAVTVATVHHMHSERTVPLAGPRPLAPSPSEFIAAAAPKPKHHLIADALHSHPLRGIASWYGSVLHGHKTASGETFEEAELTAAHRTLPFGTLVRVTDLRSLRSVIVRINDRGVLAPGRVIDLSAAAADELGILRTGIANVKLEILQRPTNS